MTPLVVNLFSSLNILYHHSESHESKEAHSLLPCNFMNILNCLATFLVFVAGNLNAATLEGKIVHVADGDTVILPFCKGVRSRNVMQPWPVSASV